MADPALETEIDEDDGADTEIDLDKDDDEGQSDSKPDRGDEVEPKLDKDALKAIADEGEDEDPDAGSKTVPHGRFHAVNEAKKALEAQNAELQRQIAALQAGTATTGQKPAAAKEEEFDLAAKQAEYVEAQSVFDNETAARILGEINAHLLKQAENNALARMETQLSQRESQRLIEGVVKDAYAKFPFLDPESEDTNEEAIGDVVGWRDIFISRGDPAHLALAKAVEKVAPTYAEPSTAPERSGIAHLAKARQSEAVKRGAEAASKQPPTIRGVGEREAHLKPIDIEKMTEEEFEKLPLAEKRRARGD